MSDWNIQSLCHNSWFPKGLWVKCILRVLSEEKQWWCVTRCRVIIQKAKYSGIIQSRKMVTVQGSLQISMRNDVHGLSKSAHVIEDEWSGCYLTLQYKPVCGCFGGTVNPVPVMTRVWVTKQHLYSYITLPCRVLFFNLIMIRPCEEVGHFSILCALLVRAAGLNCSVGIHGGSMEKLKGGKISIFLSSKLKNWI